MHVLSIHTHIRVHDIRPHGRTHILQKEQLLKVEKRLMICKNLMMYYFFNRKNRRIVCYIII